MTEDDPLAALERIKALKAEKDAKREAQRQRNRKLYPEFTAMVDACRAVFGEIRITGFKPTGGK